MPYILKKYYPPRNVFFFLGEGFLIFFSINAVYFFFKGPEVFYSTILLYGMRSLLMTAIFQLALYFFDLYDLSEDLSAQHVAARVVQAFGAGCIVLSLVYYFFPIIIIPTRVFAAGFGAVCASIFLWRFLYNYVLKKKMFAQRVIVLGTGKMAREIADEIESRRDSGFKIVSFVGDEDPSFSLPADIPVSSDVDHLPQLCQKYKIERIVVALDNRRGKTPVQKLLLCKSLGFPVEYGITFYERLAGKILVEKVNPDWFIFSRDFNKGRLLSFSKRFLDVILSLFGLLVTLPVTLISCLIIKLESPGPIFYSQERVGELGKVFRVLKFRSMRSDAEKDGPAWAQKNDTRATGYGRIMRNLRIDELPQMWNVLKGDMSFVGPRPERPVFVEKLSGAIPYYSMRHSIKPGITGWAQICYSYGASEEDALHKLEYDLYYIKYMSLQMDLWVVFQTIKTVLFQKGAR